MMWHVNVCVQLDDYTNTPCTLECSVEYLPGFSRDFVIVLISFRRVGDGMTVGFKSQVVQLYRDIKAGVRYLDSFV